MKTFLLLSRAQTVIYQDLVRRLDREIEESKVSSAKASCWRT